MWRLRTSPELILHLPLDLSTLLFRGTASASGVWPADNGIGVQGEGVADFKVSENGQLLPGERLYPSLCWLHVACWSSTNTYPQPHP